jgi:hypothetical protein
MPVKGIILSTTLKCCAALLAGRIRCWLPLLMICYNSSKLSYKRFRMVAQIRTALQSPDWLQRLTHFLFATMLFRSPLALRKWIFAGSKHYCTVCESSLRMFVVLNRPWYHWCPICASLQRHRLVWLFFSHMGLGNSPQNMLHVAPEAALTKRFASIPQMNYLSADLYDPRAMITMDICNIQFADHTFDLIYCSHVLEHVANDGQALREFQRILKPTGAAVILVPIIAESTSEDPTVTDPVERERRFGQHDHVRAYGPDVIERIAEAGFYVRAIKTEDLASPDEIRRFDVDPGEMIFLCSPSAIAASAH